MRLELLSRVLSEREPVEQGPLAHLMRCHRAAAENLVEMLIAAIDEADGDPDLEDGADDEDGGDAEPSLGSPEAGFGITYATGRYVTYGMLDQTRWASGPLSRDADECEDVSEDEGACIQSQPHDDEGEWELEPSLGSLDAQADQREWAAGESYWGTDVELDGWRRTKGAPLPAPIVEAPPFKPYRLPDGVLVVMTAS